jgi:NAD(P)H dehydrogenase (quinone)
MIVVTAATGQYGRLVVERLLDRVPVADVAVAVRDTSRAADLANRGVDVRHGDYDDPDSMRGAFDGADRLLFVSSPTLEGRVAQHRRVVDAARDAGVGLVAYTSGVGADVVDEGLLGNHHATEQALADSALPTVLLRHPIYTEIFIHPGLRAAVESGELRAASGGRSMNTATRADLADAAAALLAAPDVQGGAYDLTGPLWTYDELAVALSELSGRRVVHRDGGQDEDAFEWFGPIIRAGGFEVQTPDLERLLGRPPTGVRAAAAAALAAAG